MKRFTLLLTALIVSTSCNDKPLGISSLPEPAQIFLDSYFSVTPTFEVQKSQYADTSFHYFVPLIDGTDIIFNHKGEWESVDLGSSTDMPKGILELIPVSIVNYITENHQGFVVCELERTKEFYILKINIHIASIDPLNRSDNLYEPFLELSFDKSGNYVSSDISNTDYNGILNY